MAETSEIVFSIVTDSAAVKAVALGPDGIVSGLRKGGIYIDMSTIEPDASRAVAVEFAKAGSIMLDGPLSGSPVTVKAGHATVLVLYGDVPLITADAITALARAHEESGAAATMATMELEDPSGYGRVVRDAEGGVERVVETKTPGDATPEEEAIREVNTGIYAFAGGDLLEALKELTADNAQGELYLPDVLPLLRAEGKAIGAHVVTDPR